MIEIANKQSILKTIDYLQGIIDDANIALYNDEFGCLTFEVQVEYNKEIVFCKIAIEALKLQIPEKPILTTYNVTDENGKIWRRDKNLACPNCGYDLRITGFRCDDCGKALEWEK